MADDMEDLGSDFAFSRQCVRYRGQKAVHRKAIDSSIHLRMALLSRKACQEAVGEIVRWGRHKVLIIADERLMKAGAIDALAAALEASGSDHVIYDGCKSDAYIREDCEHLEECPCSICFHPSQAAKLSRDEGCDVILSVGGGTVRHCADRVCDLTQLPLIGLPREVDVGYSAQGDMH
eukprot:TRINITY_DN9671_c0_g1_i1.p1 TRINITY_DN9671_c0_g1~~TRINITY_DN9671_c0_g1_i1.p1  ORF type:complete len:178 (+),score=19.42 TRINITY_DN9671_c0_g1_i1:216-749(+)